MSKSSLAERHRKAVEADLAADAAVEAAEAQVEAADAALEAARAQKADTQKEAEQAARIIGALEAHGNTTLGSSPAAPINGAPAQLASGIRAPTKLLAKCLKACPEDPKSTGFASIKKAFPRDQGPGH